MGFFRWIFGSKKSSDSPEGKEKRQKKWSFSNKSRKTSSQQASNKKNPNNSCSNSVSATGHASQYDDNDNLDANKHAIAVAAATAAVAEAALAAAKAAAEVVRLTTGTASGSSQVCGNNHRWLDEFSALKIQSAFRGYLARRALRALKALVKLQALVRGHIVRKQTADMLKRMQTLVRLQARARAGRAHSSESLQSGSQSSLPRRLRCGSNTNLMEFFNQDEVQSGWFDYWVEENIQNQKNTPLRNGLADDAKNDKILEVDTWKPQLNSENNRNTYNTSHQSYVSDYSNQSHLTFDSPSKSSRKSPYLNPSISSGEVLSSSSVKYPVGKEEMAVGIAENSPQLYSASSRPGSSARRGPFTPARSECSWGYFNGYSSYPNYMANTESFRAKVRSHSAPRQRLEFEKYGTARRFVQRSWDADTSSEKGFYLRSDVRKNAYPALNRLGSSKLR